MAAEYRIAPRLLHRWRKEAVDHLPDLFADPAAAHQAEQVEALYAQMGRLTTQVAWLKKSGLDPDA